jgi:beta-galactosidase
MTPAPYAPDRILFGGDYNPEQWPRSVWDDDMRLMGECGVSIVSLGIFGWAQVEPRPGDYEFGWVDEIMDRLAEAGVRVSLATMTASPPPWMAHRHPETLPVLEDGTVLHPGARQHYCPSSPVYRRYAVALVERLAERYGEHPALALWHVGNEYGCHVALSYSDAAAEGFRAWLRERYGTIDALNEAWSTTFWSQRYDDWAEIGPPRRAPSFPNPAQQVDFRRYSSDALLACYLAEVDVLRRVTPQVAVTTNLLGVWKPVDYHRWAPHLDVVSHDSYPDPDDPEAHVRAAFAYDLMRSLRGGQPWLLMEQAPSAVNWRAHNAPKAPGRMRLWSYQAVARGADAVMYFQWRQSRGGAEKYHSAMVPHAGTDTRVHREVRALGRELADVGEIAGARSPADVAIVMDWPSWWGLELDSHPSTDLRLMDRIHDHYRPLWEANIACDVVAPGAELERYRLVVVPSLYMVSADDAERLASYVAGGGHALISFFSAIVDGADRVHLGGYPGPWHELLGLLVEELWPLAAGETVRVRRNDGTHFEADVWSEDVRLQGAEALAVFADGDLAGRPAIARNDHGAGTATYLATRPARAAMATIIADVAAAAGVRPVVARLPAGVEATRRRKDGREYLFLLNHGAEAARVAMPSGGRELLGAQRDGDALLIAPREVAIVALAS